MSHPDYARAARHLTAAAVKDALMDMVNIASPTGRESAMAEYLVHRVKKAGFAAYLQEVSENRPNAAGVRAGTGEGVNLLFTVHMDTSYDGDEDYLHGDGFKAKVSRDCWIWDLGAARHYSKAQPRDGRVDEATRLYRSPRHFWHVAGRQHA